jgi:hypothetical protein
MSFSAASILSVVTNCTQENSVPMKPVELEGVLRLRMKPAERAPYSSQDDKGGSSKCVEPATAG